MSFLKPVIHQMVIAHGASVALAVVFCSLVAAQAAADEAKQRETVDQKDKHGFGRFVSFKDGTLTLESNSNTLIVWNKIPENIKTLKYEPEANDYKQVENAAAALGQVKTGTYMMVGDKKGFIRIGAKIDQVIGAFVSFKNDRLLLLGKNLPADFVKRYGLILNYNKFRDDVPVHESIDGGEFKLIGTANKVLRDVKEGTVLTVHGEGDDNITLIQIGSQKKN